MQKYSNISKQEAAQELLNRRAARKSLAAFTSYTFEEFQPAAHHEILFDALERVERGEIKRLMVFEPPRHTKSEIASRRFPAWYLGRNPNHQIITSTYSQDFASDFGRDVRRIVSSREYQNVFPGISLDQDVRAAARWNTNKGGIYVAAGVGGPLTGRGAHIALIDDPFKDWQSAYSEANRETVWKWYLTVLRTRPMPGGAIVLVMTRWHDDDLAGRLIDQMDHGGDQWEIINLPALCDSEDDPLGREIGEALWPEWFPKEELEQTKRVMPTYEWSALYQQKPVPDEGDYFQKSWFNFYDTAPKYVNTYITHDDAVSENAGDYTEIAVWGVDENEDIYALDWFTGQVTSDIWIDKLIDLIDTYKPFYVVGESGPIKKAIEPFLIKRMQQRRTYSRLEWLASVSDKQTRAIAFRGMASMGKVHFPKTDWANDVINQLIRFPSGVHDDKVDTCSLMARVLSHGARAPKPKIQVTNEMKKDIEQKMTVRDALNYRSTKTKTNRAL